MHSFKAQGRNRVGSVDRKPGERYNLSAFNCLQVMDRPTRELQLNTPLLPILVGLVLVMQLIDPYRGWTILLVGLGGTWLLSYLWARSLARGLRLTREMRYGWAQVGDKLQERFTLINKGWAPGLWIEIVDHSTLPGYRASSVRAVGGNGSTRWYTEGTCTLRGLYTLGPTRLETGDPFGLYTVWLSSPSWVDLMVMPPIVPLPAIKVAPGGRAGEGRPTPHDLKRTVSAAGVRDYCPGDSLHLIHWPTSAHHDSLHVRLLESTPAGDWWIILDMNRQIQAGEGQDSSAEHGVILAASLADRGLRAGRSVGLIASGAELIWRSPQQGAGHRLAILRALALVELGSRPLAQVLARMPHRSGRSASLIIITSDVEGDWAEPLLPLMQRGAAPTVLLLDPVSFGGSGDAADLGALLSRAGVTPTLITRDLLSRPEARPGRRGRWEWRMTGTGRAVPLRRPRDTTWKELP